MLLRDWPAHKRSRKMAHTIERLFAKRAAKDGSTDGFRIGSCSLFLSDDGVMSIDGTVLSRQSVEYLLNFSLQSLQDAYAGCDNEIDAKKAWGDKLAALKDGTIGTRGGGEGGVSEETAVARSVTRNVFKTKYGSKSAEFIAFKELDTKDQNAKLDAMFEKNKEKLQPVVTAELKRRAAARKETAAIELDL